MQRRCWLKLSYSLGMKLVVFVLLVCASLSAANPKGILLENLSWDEAERVLTAETVVAIALGAEAKEHGKHLPLNNDWLMAEYFKRRVLEKSDVVFAPTINYSFYPAFLEYPGSTSLRFETARDMVVDLCRSLAKYGPKRFYILNTGISTIKPLTQAREELAKDAIEMRFTDLSRFDAIEKKVRTSGGTHADEIETSMMLYIAPSVVNMKKATRDLNESKPGGLTRDRNKPGTYSPTGAWGDPTLATRAKGKVVVEEMVDAIVKEIQELQAAKLAAR